MGEPLTAGLDIGTTAVKGVVAAADGAVRARVRIPHRLSFPAPDLMEHDAGEAWRRGPVRALRTLAEQLARSGGGDLRAVAVAAMVPSLTAVNARGTPLVPGLLYGDARGRAGKATDPTGGGEGLGFLRWAVSQAPGAAGFWSAPAVANHVLCGQAALDVGTAFATTPLFDGTKWDAQVLASCGVGLERFPRVQPMGTAVGGLTRRIVGPGRDILVGTGGVDAVCEQLVAGADADGDVLVVCGTTLITWAVLPAWRGVRSVWTIPHTTPNKMLIGGASNAGGLFLNWAQRMFGARRHGHEPPPDPGRVPVFSPYIRGERTPYHDPDRRAVLDGLDLTHGPAEARRAAYEAAGFVVRHHLELARCLGPDAIEPRARRLVATGGGTRDPAWMQALADCTGLPVDVAAVPEGAALGTAFLARVASGMETSITDAARWARTERTVEPDAVWADAAAVRYERFRALADRVDDR